ncbi:MAG: hypothetical protein QM533_02025 [Cytophagales bacterium]|nr:hypothetical protein [Cytophagales bacterium]
MSETEKKTLETNNELVKWLRMLALPLWARMGISIIVGIVISAGMALLGHGVISKNSEEIASAITLLSITLPVLLIVVALVFGQNSDSRLRELTLKTLKTDIPKAIQENIAAHLDDLSINSKLRGCVCEYELRWMNQADKIDKKINFHVELNVSKVNVCIWIRHKAIPEPIAANSPDLKPWAHAIAGTLAEGYKLNEVAALNAQRANQIGLVFIRDLGAEFLLLPWKRLYFVQDLAFFIRAMLEVEDK